MSQEWGAESGQTPTLPTSCFSTGNESICSPNVYIECADHTLGRCGSGWASRGRLSAPGRGLETVCANGCLPPDAAVEDSHERCSCPTPCNLTRYGKEISMVRIPNKGSARYLARKYNKNETYIR